jgi:hypothetical protein
VNSTDEHPICFMRSNVLNLYRRRSFGLLPTLLEQATPGPGRLAGGGCWFCSLN